MSSMVKFLTPLALTVCEGVEMTIKYIVTQSPYRNGGVYGVSFCNSDKCSSTVSHEGTRGMRVYYEVK